MARERTGTIGEDNPQIAELRQHIRLGELVPAGSEPHRLARQLRDLPTLPDRVRPDCALGENFACPNVAPSTIAAEARRAPAPALIPV